MTPTPLLLTLLTGAFAQTPADFSIPKPPVASPTFVSASASAAPDACAATAELNAADFQLKFEPKAAGAQAVTMVFKPHACYVHDRDGEGDPVDPPEAVRWYHSDYRNFGMIVVTVPGERASRYSLIQYSDSSRIGFLNSGYIGDRPLELSKLVPGVRLEDFPLVLYYPNYEKRPGRATLSILPVVDAEIEVVDSFNHTRELFTLFSASADGVSSFRIERSREMVETTVRGEKVPIETHGGVPPYTPAAILAKYASPAASLSSWGQARSANDQVSFTLKSGRCSPLEAALLMFWIDEWFYFG
jgi:hypothetical protein